MYRFTCLIVLALALIAPLSPAPASAHAGLPFAVGLSWGDPAVDGLPLVVTGRGLMFADGATAEQGLSLRCNESYGANSTDRPKAYLSADGTLTLGIYNRVYQSMDRGCALSRATGLPDLPITSLESAPSAPQRMYVATRNLEQLAGFFGSEDSGRTFTMRMQNKPSEYYETIVIAPSDSLRLYALGLSFDKVNKKVTFYSSVTLDGGKNWEDHVVDAKITPFGVHPTLPDVMFAYRALDKQETMFDILRSDDRGKTFKVVLTPALLPTGFTSAQGGALFLGMGGEGGLYRSRDDGQHFEQVLPEQIQRVTCLAAHRDKLWLCANKVPNLDAVWRLSDDASSLEKMIGFEQVNKPTACTGAAQEVCVMPWRDYDIELRPAADDAGVDAGAELDAGTAETDAGMASDLETGAEPESESDADQDSDAQKPGKPSARCQLGTGADAGGLSWFLLPALSLWLRGRKRSERRAAATA